MAKIKYFVISFAILILIFGFAITLYVLDVVKESYAFITSQEFLKNNLEVKDRIGDIGDHSFIIGADIKKRSSEGYAKFDYSIYGNKGKIRARLQLDTDSIGNWKVNNFYIVD